MSDLDNEENYFTRRQNGAMKDEDVVKRINNLKEYIKKDEIFNNPEKIESDFDKFCYNHCKDIETILNELKYREAEIEKDNNIISDLQNEVTIKDSELESLNNKIEMQKDIMENMKDDFENRDRWE